MILTESLIHALTRPRVSKFVQEQSGPELHEKLVTAPRAGYWPDFRNPNTFVEHLQHRKLYTDEPIFTTVADKWAVRGYVKDRVGANVLNEVYEVTSDPKTIDFESLPEEFVIKATHGSGFIEIVDKKDLVDFEQLRDKCHSWLEQPFGISNNEYWYARIDPQIIISKRLHSEDGVVPSDFKFYVFDGDVEYVHVDMDRFSGHKRRIYESDWTPTEIEFCWPLGPTQERPDRLEEMINIAEDLGEGFDFVRVDLFQTDDNGIVFGEMTLAPEGGQWGFVPREADIEFGKHWQSE